MSYSHIIMNLYGLHLELTSFEPCRTLMQTLIDDILVPNRFLKTSKEETFNIFDVIKHGRYERMLI